jgi:hypothetical protein
MSSGGKMFELTEQLRDGQIKNTRDTASSMNEVFQAQGEIAKQFSAQAQMMNFSKSGMGNYYEQVKAGTISLEDLTNAYDEADAETKKRDADTKKLAKAENDLRKGGKFITRMEAKDGSFGFDFTGVYTKIIIQERLEYSFADRTAAVTFTPSAEGVLVQVTFDAETEHTEAEQIEGWQAILNKFAKHTEEN